MTMNTKVAVNDKAELFLDKLHQTIKKKSPDESKEITQEIRSHIYESLHRGNNIEEILQCLGNPNILAKAYIADYQLDNRWLKLSSIVTILQLGVMSVASTILVPLLFLLSALFILMALSITGLAATNLLGVTQVPLVVITSDYIVTGFPQFIIAVIAAALMLLIGVSLLKLIQKYCKLVLNKYKVSLTIQ